MGLSRPTIIVPFQSERFFLVSRIKSFWLVVVLVNVLVLSISSAALGQGGSLAPRQIADANGKVRLLSFEAGALGMPVRDVRTAALATSADVVSRYASAFGASAGSNFSVLSDFTVDSTVGGTTAVRYRQTVGGVPVYGSQLIVNVRGDGAATLMSGEVSSATGLNLSPALGADAARQAAISYVAARYGVDASTLFAEDGGLWVYDPAIVKPAAALESAGLVWQFVVSSTVGQPIRAEMLMDATDANVRLTFNRVHSSPRNRAAEGANFGAGLIGPAAPLALPSAVSTRVGGSPDMATYTAGNATSLPGTFLCDETDMTCTDGADTDADSAHTHAKGTYDFYWNTHGRDSLDDAGMLLISTVHFDSGYCNAFWNGTQMAYGDGCDIVIDDVIGHELTHGVTEFSSNLIYAYDSGAINESFSDVWGEYYDLSNGTAEDIAANRWVIGEEIQAGGFRDMEDPTVWGDPDRVGSPNFWTDARDVGGVHINSGINNKAAYLMADGGTFNGQTITGLGLVKPLHIYYYVQTMLASETSTYNDLAVYLSTACDALVGGAAGITASDCEQVDKAVLATEMALPSPHLPDEAPVCDDGSLLATTVFYDDFENSTTSAANWSSTSLSGTNAWTISSTNNPLVGARSLRADNIGGASPAPVSSSVARMKNGITIPAGAYLHFVQQYAWEYDGWDGGIVEYSTNNGISWTAFSNAQMIGEQYPGRAEVNSSIPFAGQFSFTGESFGVGSTRIDLSSLSGETIKIRFHAASDEFASYGNPDGWWIDNLRVYTCQAIPVGAELLDNGGFETAGVTNGIPANWTVQNSSGDKRACPLALTNIHGGLCAFKFTGSTTDASKLTQVVDLTGVTFATGDSLTASAFFKGNNASAKTKVTLFVYYTGVTTPVKTSLNVLRNQTYTQRQTATYTLTSGAVSQVKLVLSNMSNAGTVWIDDASLIHTPAISRDASESFRGNN